MKINKQTKKILLISILYFLNFGNILHSQESNLFSEDINLKAVIANF